MTSLLRTPICDIMSLKRTGDTPQWRLRCLSKYLRDSRFEMPRSESPEPEPFQGQIDDWSRKEGKNLGDDQASDNGDSERAAKFGADTEADG